MKKIILIALLAVAFGSLVAFMDEEELTDEEIIASYEQQPPVAIRYWVKKLPDLVEGKNMLMKIQYEDDGRHMPEDLDIYHNESVNTTFHDDGVSPDVTAHDHIYTAYLTENIDVFRNKIVEMESVLTTKGGYIRYAGFAGEEITDVPHFDVEAFDEGEEVLLPEGLLNGVDCETALLKQNSLFITDLSVIEDWSRVYNSMTRQGNPYGLYTFGNLMKNMANTASTGVGTKAFMKNWLKNWTVNQVINGDSVYARNSTEHLFHYLICPWLLRSATDTSFINRHFINNLVNNSNWETVWDATNEDSLIKNAPFRLMAIINRLDTRGSLAYSTSVANTGETRFIYTLIDGYGNTGEHIPGMPISDAHNADVNGLNVMDWTGMNVIFEYQNVQTTACEMKNWAQRWYDLSAYSLPANGVTANDTLNDSLAAITSTVINANAAPGKPNGSAIGRIRTNERILFPAFAGIVGTSTWEPSSWELRQFEINAQHQLQQVGVTNTPKLSANVPYNLYATGHIGNPGFPKDNPPADLTNAHELTNWAWYGFNKSRILRGVHALPENMLAGAAQIQREQVHYWDIYWWDTLTYYTPGINSIDTASKNLRRQLSLNTCQGCHTGETKTIFTQMRPTGWGQKARYWGAYPDTIGGNIDARFDHNLTQTKIPFNKPADSNYYSTNLPRHAVPIVSAFITGRTYDGITFQDDEKEPLGEDNFDHGIKGLYYVNDPSNDTFAVNYPFVPRPRENQRHWGYNDLQRRFDDMCKVLNNGCNSGSSVISIMDRTNFNPFEKNPG